MYQNKKFLGIIPVRGGSKGLPRKNILPFMGEPLMIHAYLEAKKSTMLDRIIISTEDAEIKAIAKAAGAEVIDRPADLAKDVSPTEDALIQAADYLEEIAGEKYDYVVTLQATSPLRTGAIIDQGIQLIVDENFDSLMSITALNHRFGFKVQNEFKFLNPHESRRRQDRQALYHSNGMLYITKIDILRSTRLCTSGRIGALEIPSEDSVDIDNLIDIKIAETVYKFKQGNK